MSCSGTPRHSAQEGAGDGTSNLPVTSQTALPPEPHAALWPFGEGENRTDGLGSSGCSAGPLAGGEGGLDGQDAGYGLGLARLGSLPWSDGRLHGGGGVSEPGVKGGGGGGGRSQPHTM